MLYSTARDCYNAKMASSFEDCEPVFNILDSNYGDGDGFVPLARLQETRVSIGLQCRVQGCGL